MVLRRLDGAELEVAKRTNGTRSAAPCFKRHKQHEHSNTCPPGTPLRPTVHRYSYSARNLSTRRVSSPREAPIGQPRSRSPAGVNTTLRHGTVACGASWASSESSRVVSIETSSIGWSHGRRGHRSFVVGPLPAHEPMSELGIAATTRRTETRTGVPQCGASNTSVAGGSTGRNGIAAAETASYGCHAA